MEKEKTLRKSIILRCVLFIGILCIALSIADFFGYRNALFQRYEAYISDILMYASSNIDVDDMAECLRTGEKSEKFEETQALFDNMKDSLNIDYIYVIRPLNTEPVDNIMNIIAGMSSYEKINVPENAVTLGGLTGTDYTPETAEKYLGAADSGDEISFFEEWADRWGLEYTGILSLYDSKGDYFAEICVDVPVDEILGVLLYHVQINVAIILCIGLIFVMMFLHWSKRNITDPLQIIEAKVVELANKSRGQTDPNELVIEMPEIKTKNELQSLSMAITRLSEDLRDYLVKALSARDDAEAAKKKAMEMSDQAIRDPLTGIRNKRGYDAEVKKIEWRIKAEGFKEFGIAVVDLNNLKQINDNFGHEKGDQAIINISGIVCRAFAHSPVFRIGGDEFAVILENDDYTDIDERLKQLDDIFVRLKNDDSLGAWEKISAAVGFSMYDPSVDRNIDNIFKRADQNMYENKKKMKAAG